jgi:toxin-antitoxin system PIN domain toxin
MNGSTTSSVFPDVNVWLALSSRDHQHFPPAWNWYTALPEGTTLVFCRFTQLGFLRLLTTQAVMGPGTLTQAGAWEAYDRWLESAGTEFTEEPAGLESIFRSSTGAQQASPREWADAYLAAFAKTGGLTLVTLDRALAAKVEGAVLLG